ncbi:DUF1173 domain-containing protein [Rugamonas sp. A1-17]|nr:DUF1173 domain-containing protein [Rugamonas sp. A1-17]
MSKTFDVRVRETIFTEREQVATNPRWVRALAAAHLQDVTYCLCTPAAAPHIGVKLYGRDKPTMHYGLALWRDTGLDHDADCRFFSEDTDAGDGEGSRPAFDDLGNGQYRAHLATALAIIERRTQEIAAKKARGDASPAPSRSRANESALLFKLWRTAGLNIYRGSRSWFSASFSLIHAAKNILVNKDGDSLADFMLLGSGINDRLAKLHNAQVLERAKARPTRLFVIGRMKQYKREKQKILLPMMDFALLPKILVRIEQLDKFLDGRRFFQNLLAERAGYLVSIACIEPSGPDWWQTVSIAGIGTDLNMIPVESSFEIEFSEYLATQGRKYLKPIAIDESGTDDMRPDFILLDTPSRVYCEVWGMQTEQYLQDKSRRIANYAARRRILVSWNAFPREALPALPPRTGTAE